MTQDPKLFEKFISLQGEIEKINKFAELIAAEDGLKLKLILSASKPKEKESETLTVELDYSFLSSSLFRRYSADKEKEDEIKLRVTESEVLQILGVVLCDRLNLLNKIKQKIKSDL